MLQKSFHKLIFAVTICAISAAVPQVALSQSNNLQQSFASENAVLDTAIPFALGAREARQELRGAFGWPTFQEGLVEGVYFRFDPDGYARFAPTPRLDADVFEVICRPRTQVCMGRKGILAMTLNARGEIQLELQGVEDEDTFSIADGLTEIPLPPAIRQPLDQRLELLLSRGGELVARRGESEVERISLAGFGAVSAYLRWVAAKQDYIVLPRGWPIPSSGNGAESSGFTQVDGWRSPMRQTQIYGTASQSATDVYPETRSLAPSAGNIMSTMADAPNEIPTADAKEIYQKQEVETLLSFLVQSLNSAQETPDNLHADTETEHFSQPVDTSPSMQEPDGQRSEAGSLARRLEYLIEDIGLAPELALMLVRYGEQDAVAADKSREDAIVEILEDLGHETDTPNASAITSADKVNIARESDENYLLLSDYFRSITSEVDLK